MKERECKIELLIAEEKDFHGIEQVIQEHYSTSPKYFCPICFSEPADIAQSEKRIIFIAKAQEDILGFLSMHSEESFIHENNEAELEVLVRPRYRDKDVGEKLFVHAIQHAKEETKLKKLKAKIKKGNDAPIKLCKKSGFFESQVDQIGSVWVLEMVR